MRLAALGGSTASEVAMSETAVEASMLCDQQDTMLKQQATVMHGVTRLADAIKTPNMANTSISSTFTR